MGKYRKVRGFKFAVYPGGAVYNMETSSKIYQITDTRVLDFVNENKWKRGAFDNHVSQGEEHLKSMAEEYFKPKDTVVNEVFCPHRKWNMAERTQSHFYFYCPECLEIKVVEKPEV